MSAPVPEKVYVKLIGETEDGPVEMWRGWAMTSGEGYKPMAGVNDWVFASHVWTGPFRWVRLPASEHPRV